jgi:hypothetical protein
MIITEPTLAFETMYAQWAVDTTSAASSVSPAYEVAELSVETTPWLRLLLVADVDPPTFASPLPAPSSTGNVETSLVSVSIVDTAGLVTSGAVLSSINMTIGGLQAINGGNILPGFDGPGSSITPNIPNKGFDIVIEKTTPYPEYAVIPVYIEAGDSSGNIGSTTWSWQVVDYLGPLITPISPTNGEVEVDVGATIVVKVTDAQAINPGWMIEVRREAVFETAYIQGASPEIQSGFDGPASSVVSSSVEVVVTLDPIDDFLLSSRIYVRVTAQDPDGNTERL